MFNKKTADIMVLGAGPVGLTAAHALTDKGMDFVLVDREQHTNTHSYALALHPETLELLDRLQIIDPVLEQALRLQRVAIYDYDRQQAVIDYSQLPVKYPYLAVLGQNELESILIKSLAQKGKKPLWNHRVRCIDEYDHGAHVTVDRLMEGMTGYAVAYIDLQVDKIFEYDTRYIIGADGYHSKARHTAGIQFIAIAPAKDYAVFEFATDADLPMEMRLIVEDHGTHIFWPRPNGRCRFSFQMPPNSAKRSHRRKDRHLIDNNQINNPELSHSNLQRLLAAHAPWFKGKVKFISWRMMVHFEHRLAENFGRNRIWLAGDAAHIAPPAGILSMNVGMHEAVDLVEHLSTDDSDDVRNFRLHAYGADRLGEWKRLLDTDHHIVGTNATAAWLLQHHDDIIGNIPVSGEHLSEVLKQLHLTEAA